MYTTGKPDNAGGPLQGSTYTWKPVYAGDLIVCIREARQSGRPGDKYTVRYMEAGPGRRPYCIQLGSPTMREAHSKNYIDVEAGLCRRPYWVYKGSPTKREAR